MHMHKISILLALLALHSAVLAQDSESSTTTTSSATVNTLTAEGIGDKFDKKRRGPVLTISTHTEATQVRILADAFIDNKGYENFPIKFDFYVNQKIFSSQLRTKELPGAVGVNIPLSEYPLPFNYQVMASTIFPNGSHSTLIQGAIYSNKYATTFESCAFTLTSSATPTPTATAAELSADVILSDLNTAAITSGDTLSSDGTVSTTQDGNSSFSLSYSGTTSNDQSQESLTAKVSVSEASSASASVTVTDAEGTSTAYSLTGAITMTNDKLTGLELSSVGSTAKLSCSTANSLPETSSIETTGAVTTESAETIGSDGVSEIFE